MCHASSHVINFFMVFRLPENNSYRVRLEIFH